MNTPPHPRDLFPQHRDKGPGTACSCRALLPLPGLCSITAQESGLAPATCREEEEEEEEEALAKPEQEFPGVQTQLLKGGR